MSEQRRAKRNHLNSYTGRGHRILELLGIVIFGMLAFLIGGEVYRGLVNFGQPWLLLILASADPGASRRGFDLRVRAFPGG